MRKTLFVLFSGIFLNLLISNHSFSQSDSTFYNNKDFLKGVWIPFYLAGSVGIPVNYKTLDGNIFGSVSAGIYLGQIERSSIFFEYANYERTTNYMTFGLSLAVIKFKNNIISPEASIGFIGRKDSHGGPGIAFIPSLKFLHRFHNLIATTVALKYSPFGQYLFLNLGIQFH